MKGKIVLKAKLVSVHENSGATLEFLHPNGSGVLTLGLEDEVTFLFDAKLASISSNELADRIYDILINNVGMSEFHLPFLIDAVVNQEVGGNHIVFQIGNKCLMVNVTEVNKNYFKEK
ncbi:MAG: hypothetical protein ACFFCT_12085 [Candidatus Odinarchaeota archaeon]